MHLLGMLWQGKVYVVSFGLQSEPLIFSAIVDALEWMMMQQGACMVVNYLDDFHPRTKPILECGNNKEIVAVACKGQT